MNIKRSLAGIVATVLLCLPLATYAEGVGTSQQALIAALQAQIAVLLSQLKQLQSQSPSPAFCHTFNTDFGIGASGSEVAALATVFSIDGIGPMSSTSFDENAAGNVVTFQSKYGIRQTGFVGPLTRTKLNQLHGCISPAVTAAPILTMSAPQAFARYGEGSQVGIRWSLSSPTPLVADKYQIVVGNSVSGNEVQLYDRVSMVDLLPGSQTSFDWVVPGDLFTKLGGGRTPSSIADSFYLQVKAIRSGGYVASSQKQFFSMVTAGVSSVPLTITLTSPSASDTLIVGQHYTARWFGADDGSAFPYSVYLVGNGVSTYLGQTIVGQTTFDWTVPSSVGTGSGYQLQLSGAHASGANSASFTIAFPKIVVVSPNGTETLFAGNTVPIQFATNLNDKQTSGISLQLYRGATIFASDFMYIQDIVRGWTGGSPYSWTIPGNLPAGNYMIHASADGVESYFPKGAEDFSDKGFAVLR